MKKIEIYSKEWCPYCNKAKSLLQSKSLEYIEIDITHDAAVEQKMSERSQRQTVPQIFIDEKAIGGYDDLSQLNSSGELDQLLGIEMGHDLTKIYDVVIVGAGPAGMTAAVYTARKNLSTLVVSIDIGGQMGTTNEIENYPGIHSISGPELVTQFDSHAETHGIEKMIGEKVVSLTADGRCRILTTQSGKTIHARSVILASGAFKRKLDIPGEKKLAGKGVVYCATCDGPLFKGKRVAVIGGGNSALEAAIEMESIASEVHIVSIDEWNGDNILQDKVNSSSAKIYKHYLPSHILGENKVNGLKIQSTKNDEETTLDIDAVFIEIGLAPNSDYALDMIETNDRAEIKVDRDLDTGLRGVFAAGDVTDGKDKQIVVAAGQGANAALSVFNYLIHQA